MLLVMKTGWNLNALQMTDKTQQKEQLGDGTAWGRVTFCYKINLLKKNSVVVLVAATLFFLHCFNREQL